MTNDNDDRFDAVDDFRAAITSLDSKQSLEFTAATGGVIRSDEELADTGLRDVAANLLANSKRLTLYSTFPQALFDFGRMYQQAYFLLCSQHGRNLMYPLHFVPDDSDDEVVKLHAVHEALEQWAAGNLELPIGGGIGLFESGLFASPSDQHRKEQIAGFIESVVVQAWTIFESFSEDLWEAALNARPSKLASLGGKAKVSLDDLAKHGFNVKSRMGTILKDKGGNVRFRTLSDIQESYKLAFSEQGASIDAILAEPRLRYAAAVRNLIIHKRGIVDDEFVKQVSGIPSAPRLIVGEPFMLTGKLSASLTTTCRIAPWKLLRAVHAWLIGHPEKTREAND